MKQIVVYTILLMNVLLVACESQSANAQAGEEPVFAVTADNGDDEITLQYIDNTTTIEIKSPFGIGTAIFKLESGQMPEMIILRLYLKGLEELRLISDEHIVVASVPSSEGIKAQSQRKISGNSEQAIRSSDALWLDIRIVSESQKVPLQDGYFEIVIPTEFIREAVASFEIRWIDFFR